MKSRIVYLMMAVLLLVMSAGAQQTAAGSGSATVVPQLIKFSGVAKAPNGQPMTGIVGITFALYSEQQGGAPLWLETQNVQLDAHGNYTVQVGATQANGVPASLFNTGEARWVGVQISGQEEQPRTLLTSVPYAMKAGDAQTLAGMPASAFVQANAGAGGAGSGGSGAGKAGKVQPNSTTITGSGTTDYVPLWTSSSALGNSVLFQSSGNVDVTAGSGITINGTQDGAGTSLIPNQLFFQDNGEIASHDANHRLIFDRANNILELRKWGNLVFSPGSTGGRTSTVTVPAGGGITVVGDLREDFNNANKGSYTPGLRFGSGNPGEGISSDRVGTVNQWGIDFYTDYLPRMSVTNAGSVGIGTQAPAATLEVNGTGQFDGLVTFASNQTFPGTATLGANTFTGAQTINNNVTVSATGTALLASGGTIGLSSTGANEGVYGYSSSVIGVYGVSSSGIGVCGLNGSGPCPSGTFGVYGGSSSSTGVYGSGVGNGVFGDSGSGDGVYGSSGSGAGVYGVSSSGIGVYGSTNASQPAVSGVNGGTNGCPGEPYGVCGYSGTAYGVYGGSTYSTGVAGVSSTGYQSGVYGENDVDDGVGVSGVSKSGIGVSGTSTYDIGVYGYSSGASEAGVYGENDTAGAIGVEGYSDNGYAGYFEGNVKIIGNLSKSSGSFLIDHPLDPANKYLYHSFVESPDMMNIYNGNVILDEKGTAWIMDCTPEVRQRN
jgi:hypothetical protein